MTHTKPLSRRAALALTAVVVVVVYAAWIGLQVMFPEAVPFVRDVLTGAGLGALSLLIVTLAPRFLPRKPTEEDA